MCYEGKMYGGVRVYGGGNLIELGRVVEVCVVGVRSKIGLGKERLVGVRLCVRC